MATLAKCGDLRSPLCSSFMWLSDPARLTGLFRQEARKVRQRDPQLFGLGADRPPSDLCPENIDRFPPERTQPDRPGYRFPPATLAPGLANPTVPLRKPEAKPSLDQP